MVTAPQENRKPGENPGRYRRCMRGGCALDESRSLGKPEKAVWSLGCVSQKNCLNVGKHQGLQVRSLWFFVAEKRLRHSFRECRGFFAASSAVRQILLAWIAPAVQSATQLNIALLMPIGDPVRIRNNRPLLCFSQRAFGINRVFHALTGECSRIYPYLRINRLHFLFCGKTTKQ